jgi:hypothetical protein
VAPDGGCSRCDTGRGGRTRRIAGRTLPWWVRPSPR